MTWSVQALHLYAPDFEALAMARCPAHGLAVLSTDDLQVRPLKLGSLHAVNSETISGPWPRISWVTDQFLISTGMVLMAGGHAPVWSAWTDNRGLRAGQTHW